MHSLSPCQYLHWTPPPPPATTCFCRGYVPLVHALKFSFGKKNSSNSIRSCQFFYSWVVVWPYDGPGEGLKHAAVWPEYKVLCVECTFVWLISLINCRHQRRCIKLKFSFIINTCLPIFHTALLSVFTFLCCMISGSCCLFSLHCYMRVFHLCCAVLRVLIT
jgi:hypothetical protein